MSEQWRFHHQKLHKVNTRVMSFSIILLLLWHIIQKFIELSWSKTYKCIRGRAIHCQCESLTKTHKHKPKCMNHTHKSHAWQKENRRTLTPTITTWTNTRQTQPGHSDAHESFTTHISSYLCLQTHFHIYDVFGLKSPEVNVRWMKREQQQHKRLSSRHNTLSWDHHSSWECVLVLLCGC